MPPHDTMIAGNLDQFITLLAEAGPGLDMCELCGGEARATTVAVRRRLKTGKNFDLATHVDLNDPKVQRQVRQYIDDNEVLVVVMGPTCRTLGTLLAP